MKLKVLKNGSLANDLFSAFQAAAMKSFDEKRKSKKTDQCCLQHCCMQSCQQSITIEKSVGDFVASMCRVNALQI